MISPRGGDQVVAPNVRLDALQHAHVRSVPSGRAGRRQCTSVDLDQARQPRSGARRTAEPPPRPGASRRHARRRRPRARAARRAARARRATPETRRRPRRARSGAEGSARPRARPPRAARAACRARPRSASAACALLSPPPGHARCGSVAHAQSRYAANGPPSYDPTPISSSPGSTSLGTSRPPSASSSVSCVRARRDRDAEPERLGRERLAERERLLDSPLGEPLARAAPS